MKKYLSVLLAVVLTLMLTGCGGKKLTCTKEEEEMGMKMQEKAIVSYSDDKISKYTMEATIELTEEMEEYADQMLELLTEEMNMYEEIKGVEVNTEKKGNKIIATVVFDVDKMDEEDLDEIDDFDVNETIEEVKAELEDQGFTCK